MAANGNPMPKPQSVQMGMQCTVQQINDQIVVVVDFQCGALSAALMVPAHNVRLMARQLIEAADNADKTLIKPQSLVKPS
jgi:hypothetical protein